MPGYRSRTSYIAKDPEARAKQLANLKKGNKPGTLQKREVVIKDIPGWNIEIKIMKK
jgi:hypothetical protein